MDTVLKSLPGKTTISELLGDAAALDDDDLLSADKEKEILQDFCRNSITDEECKSDGDYAFCAFDENQIDQRSLQTDFSMLFHDLNLSNICYL